MCFSNRRTKRNVLSNQIARVGSTLIAFCAHVWQWIRKVGFLELIFLVFQTGAPFFSIEIRIDSTSHSTVTTKNTTTRETTTRIRWQQYDPLFPHCSISLHPLRANSDSSELVRVCVFREHQRGAWWWRDRVSFPTLQDSINANNLPSNPPNPKRNMTEMAVNINGAAASISSKFHPMSTLWEGFQSLEACTSIFDFKIKFH